MSLYLKRCSDNTTLYLKFTPFICFASDIYVWKPALCVHSCNTWVYLFRGCAEHRWLWPVVSDKDPPRGPASLSTVSQKKKRNLEDFSLHMARILVDLQSENWTGCKKEDLQQRLHSSNYHGAQGKRTIPFKLKMKNCSGIPWKKS